MGYKYPTNLIKIYSPRACLNVMHIKYAKVLDVRSQKKDAIYTEIILYAICAFCDSNICAMRCGRTTWGEYISRYWYTARVVAVALHLVLRIYAVEWAIYFNSPNKWFHMRVVAVHTAHNAHTQKWSNKMFSSYYYLLNTFVFPASRPGSKRKSQFAVVHKCKFDDCDVSAATTVDLVTECEYWYCAFSA